jgi:hypothetical protein
MKIAVDLTQFTADLGITSHVKFLGHVPETHFEKTALGLRQFHEQVIATATGDIPVRFHQGDAEPAKAEGARRTVRA